MPKQLTVAETRKVLERNASFWFPRMELLGASKRRRKAYEQEQDALEIEHNIRCQKLREIAELPDEDLQWLLDSGWSPFDS